LPPVTRGLLDKKKGERAFALSPVRLLAYLFLPFTLRSRIDDRSCKGELVEPCVTLGTIVIG
jgi:hypothetical protein